MMRSLPSSGGPAARAETKAVTHSAASNDHDWAEQEFVRFIGCVSLFEVDDSVCAKNYECEILEMDFLQRVV